MATGLRISAFLLALAAVFGIAFGVGSLLEPADAGQVGEHGGHSAAPTAPTGGTTAP